MIIHRQVQHNNKRLYNIIIVVKNVIVRINTVILSNVRMRHILVYYILYSGLPMNLALYFFFDNSPQFKIRFLDFLNILKDRIFELLRNFFL